MLTLMMTPGPLMADPVDAFPLYRRFIPYDGQGIPEVRPSGPDPNGTGDRGPDPWEDRDASACELVSFSAAHLGSRRLIEGSQFAERARKEVLGGVYDREQEELRRPRRLTITAAAEYNMSIAYFQMGGNSAYLGEGQLRHARSQLDAAVRHDEEFAADELYRSVDRALTALEQFAGSR